MRAHREHVGAGGAIRRGALVSDQSECRHRKGGPDAAERQLADVQAGTGRGAAREDEAVRRSRWRGAV